MVHLVLPLRALGVGLMSFIICIHTLNAQTSLRPDFYDKSCPSAQSIIKSVLAQAVRRQPRIAASVLRLHFHDCFVQGCDASLLLDDTANFTGEKTANPNRNSARGFEVIDRIKSALEKACPATVSCADILAFAARDSVSLSGGPFWVVPVGRRDSRSASKSGANNNIPIPNSTYQTLQTKFKLQGLNVVDLVTLSGGHTIGLSRCTSFKQRIYNQTGNGKPDPTIEKAYLKRLRSVCPPSGGDNNTTPLDLVSPTKFDNQYYKNLQAFKGLLQTDEELYTSTGSNTQALVKSYAKNAQAFFKQFAISMVKMGNIRPLTGSHGEIRKNCRKIN